MEGKLYTHYSKYLQREMHILVHGHTGVPFVAIPCQDGMCDNWASFNMQDTLQDFLEEGKIQVFCVDTVDRESWSDINGDKEHRAWVQEQYYNYIVEEAVPFIKEINGTGKLPVVTGFSLGATHSVILFYRRPDIFGGLMACSGCYDAFHFWDDWSNSTLYDNSPVHFLANLPKDHPYIELYNKRKAVICIGQGRWEAEGIRTTGILRDIFAEKGINSWVDFWGYDVDHDWPWWRKQVRYFIPWIIEENK